MGDVCASRDRSTSAIPPPLPSFTHVTEFVTHNVRAGTSGDTSRSLSRRPRIDLVIGWMNVFGSVISTSTRGTLVGDGYDFVVVLASPSMACMECMLGCLGAGCVLVPVNTRWSLDEMVDAVSGLGRLMAVVVDDEFEREGRTLCDRLDHVVDEEIRLIFLEGEAARTQGSTWDPNGTGQTVQSGWAEQSKQFPLRKAPRDAAFIIYTSGTSSPKPKAAMLTHDNVIFQCTQKERVCGYHGGDHGDVYLHVAPWFHVGGLVSALSMVMVGAKHVYMGTTASGRGRQGFDAGEVLSVLEQEGCTSFIAVPTMMRDLMQKYEVRGGKALSRVERVLVGAGGLRPEEVRRAQRMMPNAVLITAYGMTEACSSISYLKVVDAASCSGELMGSSEDSRVEEAVFVGEVPQDIRVGVLTASGTVLHEGTGELLTSGRHVFAGYYGMRVCLWPASCASSSWTRRLPEHFVMDFRDGRVWFRTGDIGHVDNNRIWLSGRIKDMIKTGGENVHAAEVERVLASLQGVDECSVFSVPDTRWGEAVAAAIVVDDAWGPALEGNGTVLITADRERVTGVYDCLRNHCRQQGLASFKVPKYLILMNGRSHSLPKNATGKVLKQELQDETVRRLARERERLANGRVEYKKNRSFSSAGRHRSKL